MEEQGEVIPGRVLGHKSLAGRQDTIQNVASDDKGTRAAKRHGQAQSRGSCQGRRCRPSPRAERGPIGGAEAKDIRNGRQHSPGTVSGDVVGDVLGPAEGRLQENVPRDEQEPFEGHMEVRASKRQAILLEVLHPVAPRTASHKGANEPVSPSDKACQRRGRRPPCRLVFLCFARPVRTPNSIQMSEC